MNRGESESGHPTIILLQKFKWVSIITLLSKFPHRLLQPIRVSTIIFIGTTYFKGRGLNKDYIYLLIIDTLIYFGLMF